MQQMLNQARNAKGFNSIRGVTDSVIEYIDVMMRLRSLRKHEQFWELTGQDFQDMMLWVKRKIVMMENSMKPYEYVEHTADMGLRVRGKNLPKLLTNAAQGLFETIAVVDTVDETTSVEIHLTAESVEDLFVAWLDELIFQHETKEIFFKRAKVQQCSETEILATAYGEPANFDKHAVYTEIKSVTYHQLEVVQKPDGSWFAQVIFDL